jgi:hypothetical protein
MITALSGSPTLEGTKTNVETYIDELSAKLDSAYMSCVGYKIPLFDILLDLFDALSDCGFDRLRNFLINGEITSFFTTPVEGASSIYALLTGINSVLGGVT